VLIIPPGDTFSPFENLIYPFRNSVWLSLLITIISSLFAALFYRKIYDKNLKLSFVDVMIIIVGGSQTSLPQKHHKRIILATFLLFFLVIRGLYQGALFEFLQADKRHKEVEKIDEMMEKGFKFYMYPAYEQHVMEMKFYSRCVEGRFGNCWDNDRSIWKKFWKLNQRFSF
jgi:uncharacterized membrane protein YfcA